MNNKKVLESLSMDLLRVAIGFHRGSYKMAERFSAEALKRKQEVSIQYVKPYLKNILNKLDQLLENTDIQKKSEDTLMYSTLIRNYCQKYLS